MADQERNSEPWYLKRIVSFPIVSTISHDPKWLPPVQPTHLCEPPHYPPSLTPCPPCHPNSHTPSIVHYVPAEKENGSNASVGNTSFRFGFCLHAGSILTFTCVVTVLYPCSWFYRTVVRFCFGFQGLRNRSSSVSVRSVLWLVQKCCLTKQAD